MKVAVVYGNARHGSTWNAVQLYLKELNPYGTDEIKEFFLPQDMPHFCLGCFTCFLKGENSCPHAGSVQPLAKFLEAADIIVLASPVYGLDVTGSMKALIDHLCYMWISHRPAPEMFRKVGVVITTTAGAGLSHTAKTMRSSLQFWGVKRVYTIKKAIAASKWEEVSEKNKAKLRREAARVARSSVRSLNRIGKVPVPYIIRILFGMMRGMQKKNTWNETDRAYWESNGWLAGNNPF